MNYIELKNKFYKEHHTHSDTRLLRYTVDYMDGDEYRNKNKTLRQLITEYLKYRYQIK